MGVSGSGKTTVGRALARQFGWTFLDADDYHPATRRSHEETTWCWPARRSSTPTRTTSSNTTLSTFASKNKFNRKTDQMGYIITAYAVKLSKVTGALGSKNKRLVS